MRSREGVREFSNGLKCHREAVEEIAELLHVYTCDCDSNCTEMECPMKLSYYEGEAERIYLLLGGKDQALTFIRNLRLVKPEFLIQLAGVKNV